MNEVHKAKIALGHARNNLDRAADRVRRAEARLEEALLAEEKRLEDEAGE